MTIETKFKVGDLVHYKFYVPTKTQKKNADIVIAHEIIEIKSVTCMAGTQTFYQTRPIHAIKLFDDEPAMYLPGHMRDGAEYQSFREDELKECSDVVKNLIIGL